LNDTKLRASEIAWDINHAPNCIFTTKGKIVGSLFIDFKVGTDLPLAGFVGYEKKFTINQGALIDFTSHNQCNPENPPPPPVLASQPDANGRVTLFMGPNASQRQNVADDPGDGNETFDVSDFGPGSMPNTEKIGVTAFGSTQTIDNVKSIYGDGGQGNNVIFVDKGVTSDAELHGGQGNNNVAYLGSGKATLYGGPGSNSLTVGPDAKGGSTVYGGNGSDGTGGDAVITLGGGADTAYGEGGPNTTDIFNVGTGNNQTLYGGQGKNQFYAGVGTSTMNGGAGSNLFVWQAGNGAIIVKGVGSNNTLEADDNQPPTPTPTTHSFTVGDDGSSNHGVQVQF